ncbi:MAG TPA: HDIG domain-containing protein [Acidobacteriota bacterium]|nr:HDIG domain-containing protein [Acidobacteriota bacterium]HQG92997.1 HDIG domain-containing protein [Acidobacteriota bacterium]HQK86436.1 HDIG domain-containing protein [Acidobacteriota bacterium]
MDSQLLIFGLSLIAFVAVATTVFLLARQSTRERKRVTSILTSFDVPEEEMDTESEIKEIRSHQYRFYRISGFKWIISVFFALLLVLLTTFEFWVDYFPEPMPGKAYPINLKISYPFSFKKIHYSPQDSPLLARNKIVTIDDLELVKAYRASRRLPALYALAGYYVVYQLLILILVFWFGQFSSESREDENKNLVFVFLVILLVLLVAKFASLTGIISVYYVPVAMLAMLVNILIYNKIVPSLVIFTTIFVAILSDFDSQLMLVLFSGGIVTLFWLQNVKKRSQVFSTGLAVGITNLVIYLAIVPMTGERLLSAIVQQDAVGAFLNGPLSSILTLLLIPVFEKVFGHVSPFRLMELTDLDSALLRELYLKAPGSYHHSLAVANLAEIAANEIGANALLLRVGAYYHDIGKMLRPTYFVENINPQGDNPHDKISPYASSKILKSHIILGVELGRKFKLPRKILDFIPQHHGTTVMDYFYEKAKNNPETAGISGSYFAYPGPRPRSREATILMVVDSVEAASRVLTDHSEETVRKAIEKIINHKLTQSQLDESPLTLSELRRITTVLTKALATATHKRIDYPAQTGIHAQFGQPAQPAAAAAGELIGADTDKLVIPDAVRNGEAVPPVAADTIAPAPKPPDGKKGKREDAPPTAPAANGQAAAPSLPANGKKAKREEPAPAPAGNGHSNGHPAEPRPDSGGPGQSRT